MPEIKPLAWATWETPDRAIVRSDVKNETGNSFPRLLFATFANGALKIAATRRPLAMLSIAAGTAKAMHTWIDSVLLSEPEVTLGKVAQMLTKRLRLEGNRYIGGGVFENVPVEAALKVLAQIRSIETMPEAPIMLRPESAIPSFLGKENVMPDATGIVGLPTLTIAGTEIRRDDEGRFCLNDLHKAAGGEKRHQPSNWLRTDQTKELIEEIKTEATESSPHFRGDTIKQPLASIPGSTGSGGGTYVCKELVYAYAMWISPKFHLAVIRAFDALVTGRVPEVAGNVLPETCEGACDARTWFLFNQVRQSILALLGSSVREGDDERLLDSLFWTKTRLHEQLRVIAMRQLAQHRDPKAVAAWVMNWTPNGTGQLH